MEALRLPHVRPMPDIGKGCAELRIRDANHYWMIVYRVDADAIPIVKVFPKTTQKTPRHIIDTCKRRLSRYDGARRAPNRLLYPVTLPVALAHGRDATQNRFGNSC
jgi:phage-related protein